MELKTIFSIGGVLSVVLLLLRRSSRVSKYIAQWSPHSKPIETLKDSIKQPKTLNECHEVAEALGNLIREDGAGSWPPAANHRLSDWPEPLRSYRHIYLELAPSLSQTEPSLDDEVNVIRIVEFRRSFRKSLDERVDLTEVIQLMQKVDAGHWDEVPRDVYNAFYCCIAWCRHAYRWATIPVVKVAQFEKELDLPAQLVEPWSYIQRHFGCPSDSGNIISNRVLNFDMHCKYMYKINTGMSQQIQDSEEAFARIFHDLETSGLRIYRYMVHAITAFDQGNKAACAQHVASIASHMRHVLSAYFDRLHDKMIARSVWLSYVQGFDAWDLERYNSEIKEWEKFNGLSGNQVLLFQALDAFLGIDQYLSPRDQERNVPRRQRELCGVLRKYSFRDRLGETMGDEHEVAIARSMDEIVKRLRMFRAAHRARALTYLSQSAPERVPMTAGKSTLEGSFEDGMAFLDEFMVKRLTQTV